MVFVLENWEPLIAGRHTVGYYQLPQPNHLLKKERDAMKNKHDNLQCKVCLKLKPMHDAGQGGMPHVQIPISICDGVTGWSGVWFLFYRDGQKNIYIYIFLTTSQHDIQICEFWTDSPQELLRCAVPLPLQTETSFNKLDRQLLVAFPGASEK